MSSEPGDASAPGPDPNLSSAEPPRISVAKAGALMVASLFLSRVLGTVRDVVIAASFGMDASTDAYRLAFQVPDLIFFLVAGGALSSAFIPVFSEYYHQGKREEAWHVFNAVASWMSLLVGALILAAWLAAPWLAAVVSGGREGVVPMVAHMSRILLPAQFAFFVGGLMMGVLYVRQVFSVPGLGPNLYNLGIISGAVLLGGVLQPGISGATWGALAGAFLGNIVVPGVVLARLGVPFRPTLSLAHPGVRKVFKLMVPVVLGLSLPGVYGIGLQYFATFYPTGVNTALDQANRLMQAPLGIFGQALALAAFPALSQFRALGQMGMFRDQLVRSMQQTVYLALPAATLFAAAPRLVVSALYQHGKFDALAAARTAAILQWCAVGVVAWCLHPVLMRAYYSLQKNVTPIVLGTVATAVFVAACLWLRWSGGPYPLLGLTGSAAAVVLVVLLLADLRRQLGGLDLRPLGRTFGLGLAACAPAAAVAAGGQAWAMSAPLGKAAFLLSAAAVVLATGWAYAGATLLFQMDEAELVRRGLRRLGRK